MLPEEEWYKSEQRGGRQGWGLTDNTLVKTLDLISSVRESTEWPEQRSLERSLVYV